MAYTQISGLVSKTNSNGGVMSFDLDGKPVTIEGVISNQVLDGHNLIVAGKQKDSGFSGIGFYDKTNGTTVKSFSKGGKLNLMLGVFFIFFGFIFSLIVLPLGVIIIGFGGFFIWSQYMVPSKFIDSLKKGAQ